MKEEAEIQAKQDAEREAQHSSPKEPTVGVFSQAKLPEMGKTEEKPEKETEKETEKEQASENISSTKSGDDKEE